VDLNQADAEAAAKDLVDWFGELTWHATAVCSLHPVSQGETQPGEVHATGYGCDVANEQSVKDTFAKIEAEFGGRIDVSRFKPHHCACTDI
jgi:D-arabinitol 2-dehydrogenase